jgi:hypothetical protein
MRLRADPDRPSESDLGLGFRRMAEYRIRHTAQDVEGETRAFVSDRDAKEWWTDYSLHHLRRQSLGLVLERQAGAEWIPVSTPFNEGHAL